MDSRFRGNDGAGDMGMIRSRRSEGANYGARKNISMAKRERPGLKAESETAAALKGNG